MTLEASAIATRIAQWAAASPRLQEVRDTDIRGADTARALRHLTGTILLTASRLPVRSTSGLVDQQRIFLKIRSA